MNIGLLALLIAGLLVPAGAPAHAQSDPIQFIVNATADGVCSSTKAPAAPGCTLRAAIMQANALRWLVSARAGLALARGLHPTGV